MKHLKNALFLSASLLMVAACGGDDDDTGNNSPDAGETNDPDAGEQAQPRGEDNPPTVGAQVDRVGRPAITTATIATFNGDSTAKDTLRNSYNTAAEANWSGFSTDIMSSLAILDSLDENCGSQLAADTGAGDRYSFLAGVLADDKLYVNAGSGTCGTYLGLEAEVLEVIEPGAGGCGGRTLDDDVIERSYSVLATGTLDAFDDTIEANDVPNSATFPFLAAPQ